MTARSSLALLALVLVAVAAALVLALRRSDEHGTSSPAPRVVDQPIEHDAARSELASDVAAPANTAPRADARDAAATDDAGGLYITGYLREPSGKRVSGRDVDVVITERGWRQSASPDANGAFVFGPFEPGAFDLAVRSRRHDPASLHVDLVREDARRVREIVLVPHVEILVRAQTPDGAPLARAMMSSSEFGFAFRARVVARAPREDESTTSHAPPEWIGTYAGIGGPEGEWTGADEPPDAIGRLVVPSLPVVACLRLGERVIDSVVARADEIVFVLPLERMGAALTSIRATAVDAESRSGAPLLDAWIRMGEGDGRNFTIEGTNREGLLELRGLPDGPAPLRIGAPGHVEVEHGIFLQGGALDLGPIALERTVTLRGRVVDAEGNAVEHQLELVSLGEPNRRQSRWIRSAKDRGFEEPEVPPGRYMLRTSSAWDDMRTGAGDGPRPLLRVRPREIVVSRSVDDELVLPLEAAYLVTFELTGGHGAYDLVIERRDGVRIWGANEAHAEHDLHPGDYRARWSRGANDFVERDFTVGEAPLTVRLP